MAAFSGFFESHEPFSILPVSYRRIAMAIEMASKVGVFCIVDFVDCRHGSRQGNT
jgi:hypothetical protein